MDNTIEEMKDFSVLMNAIYKAVEMAIARSLGIKKDYKNQEYKMMMACSVGSPLRSIQISGGIKGGIMPGLLEMANGHFLREFGRMIKGE